MKQEFVTNKFWLVRTALISWLALAMLFGTAQAATVSYTMDDIFLADGTQLTGVFDWSYDIGGFEGGSGVFTALEVPWRPIGTAPLLSRKE